MENKMEMVEFEFPDEVGKKVVAQVEEDDVDLVIEDDTPEQDRNRAPLPKEIVNELENDELEDYSEKVKIRMKQMKKVWSFSKPLKVLNHLTVEATIRVTTAASTPSAIAL